MTSDIAMADPHGHNADRTTADLVDALIGYFAGLTHRLRAEQDRLTAALTTPGCTSDDLIAATRPFARELLDETRILGAGLVVAPETLGVNLLAWWQGDNTDPLGIVDSADYTRQEWFHVPARTRAPHVTGPYVDFVCSDEYVMTLTIPVIHGEDLLAVIGADTLLTEIESMVYPLVAKAGATVINGHDRVVLSADPGLFSGDRLDRSRFKVAVPCAGLPLVVLTNPR